MSHFVRYMTNMEDNMKKFRIDFAIISEGGIAYSVTGDIPLEEVPVIGDKITFPLSDKYWSLFDNDDLVFIVTKQMTVQYRVMIAGQEGGMVLMLDEMAVRSAEDAKKIAVYFDISYGLDADTSG